MVEGTINACNSLFYHLEDMLDIPHEKLKWHKRIKGIKTEGIFIPGFAGLASPYWEPGFDDILINLNINNKDEIVRAGMESIGFLVNDIVSRLLPILDKKPEVLTTSGGGVGLPGLTIFEDKLGITETQWNRVAAVIKKFETVDKEGSAMYSKMADYDTNGKLSDNGRRLLNDLEESGLFLWKHRLVLWVFKWESNRHGQLCRGAYSDQL